MISREKLIDINLGMLLKSRYRGYDNKTDFYIMSEYINLLAVDDYGYVMMLNILKKYSKDQLQEFRKEILYSIKELQDNNSYYNLKKDDKNDIDFYMNFNFENGKTLIFTKRLYLLKNILKDSNIKVFSAYLISIDNKYLYTFLKLCEECGIEVNQDYFKLLSNQNLDVFLEGNILNYLNGFKQLKEAKKLQKDELYKFLDKIELDQQKRLITEQMITFGIYKYKKGKEEIYFLSIPYIDNIESFCREIEKKFVDNSYRTEVILKLTKKRMFIINTKKIFDLYEYIITNCTKIEKIYNRKFDLDRFNEFFKSLNLNLEVTLNLDSNYKTFTCKFNYNIMLINAVWKIDKTLRSYDPKGRCYHIENSQLYNLKKAFEMLPINIQMINYDKIRNEIISLGIEIEAKLSKLKRIAIEERGKYVKLSFEYSEKMVKSIKELDASLRKYDDKTKSWTIPKNVLRILLSILKKNKIDAFYDISKIEKLKYDYENKPIQLNFVNKTNDFIELMPNEFNSTYEKLLEKYKTLNSERIIIPIDQLEDFKNFENENNIILGEDSLKSLKDTFNDVSYKLRNEKFKAIDFNSLKRKPFPHQSEIVEDMLNLKRFILADEMGLGKTYESILFAASIPYKKLVICPATLLFNWRKEILQALPNSYVRVIDSNTNIKKYEPLPEEGWLIINYELLEKFHDKLLDEKFNVLLCDEAHYIKGVDNKGFSNTKRAKNTLKIAENIPFKCALTGTPITNKPKDCWNLLRFIESKEINIGFETFKKYFKDSNAESLHSLLRNKMIRRLKKDILDLQESTRMFVPNRVNDKEYNKKLKEYWNHKGDKYIEFMAYLNSLRYILAKEKVKSTISLAENLLLENEKVVIFTNYTEPAEKFKNHFKNKAVLINGDVPIKERQKIIEDFQNGESKVFIGNLKAASVGITLTKANIVIFNDFDYVPATHIQAEERIHRIGQDKECNIFYNYAENIEIDEWIAEMLEKKFNMISKIVDNRDSEFIEDGLDDITKELFNRFFKK